MLILLELPKFVYFIYQYVTNLNFFFDLEHVFGFNLMTFEAELLNIPHRFNQSVRPGQN